MESLAASKPNSNPWLHAWYDPLAGLKTVASCVRLTDLNGDGDTKLCVCDFSKKLKVYKGTSLIVEYALLDVPVAMCAVFTERSTVIRPRTSSKIFLPLVPNLISLFTMFHHTATTSVDRSCSWLTYFHLPTAASVSEVELSAYRYFTDRD
jgi:Ciliary BBSome complex subunit 1